MAVKGGNTWQRNFFMAEKIKIKRKKSKGGIQEGTGQGKILRTGCNDLILPVTMSRFLPFTTSGWLRHIHPEINPFMR